VGCILETVYRDGQVIGMARRCYDRTLELMSLRAFHFLNVNTNRTVFSFKKSKATLSASICNKNYCNGPIIPVNASPRLHSPTLLVAPTFTILLPYFLSLTGQAAATIECYNCFSQKDDDPCQHMPDKTIKCGKGCTLETVYTKGRVVNMTRRCYDKTLHILNKRAFLFLNLNTNRTVFSFEGPNITLSASICNKKLCNGPYHSASPRLHSPTLLVAPTFTILLPYFLFLTGLL
ncbi:uncharacterized protein LOC115224715, partial [Argonauta hians]